MTLEVQITGDRRLSSALRFDVIKDGVIAACAGLSGLESELARDGVASDKVAGVVAFALAEFAAVVAREAGNGGVQCRTRSTSA